MPELPVYLDNHSTTRVDPRVLEAMLPLFERDFGNAGSTSHAYGWDALEAVDQARKRIASILNATPREIVFTSGATESNNLAVRGLAERRRRKGDHIISLVTEHKAMLDPLKKLERRGFEVQWLPVKQQDDPRAGEIVIQQLADAIRDDTLMVSVMMANNEIGVLQPMEEIGRLCRERNVTLHSDATQAVGKVPVDVNQLNVDMLSFSAHKIYGPKGVGGLYVRRGVRLESQIDGGAQERGIRSGTLNVPGIVGLATALELCNQELASETERLGPLRNQLFQQLVQHVPEVTLNGPDLDLDCRLAANLNCSFADVDGEALMMSMRDLAVSSGSACTSANPEPSHVLRALGLSDDRTRSSLRFGLGRFNAAADIDFAVETIGQAVGRLRSMAG